MGSLLMCYINFQTCIPFLFLSFRLQKPKMSLKACHDILHTSFIPIFFREMEI
jgi:hypothetical protein